MSAERPGGWGTAIIGVVLAAAFFPALWLMVASVVEHPTGTLSELFRGPFAAALKRSLVQTAWVAAVSLALGWPFGVMCGLVDWPGRRFALALMAPALFLPVFLWAIGWASWRAWLPYRYHGWVDGLPGCVLALATQATPLVVLATVLATRTIPRSTADAARVAGGSRPLLCAGARLAFPASLCAALLGAMLTLADPGPAQIMGYHGASSEILIALAARNDMTLAGMKSVALACVVLPLMAVIAWRSAAWVEGEFLGRELTRVAPLRPRRWRWALGLVLLASPVASIGLPLAGLVRPLLSPPVTGAWDYSIKALRDSAGPTVWYNLTAGVIAAGLGLALMFGAGRSRARRRTVLLAGLLLLGMTPALHALGWARLAASAPAWLDGLTRSGWTVGLASGLRLMSVAAIFLLVIWARLPRSMNEAGEVHGVPAWQMAARVWLPWLGPALMASVIAVALLALSDVGTSQLLQPPGGSTFALRLFAVMDNASERLVAALCLVYLITGALAATAVFAVSGAWQKDKRV
jgi:ABC-type Fe3+ transport system permease subunit